MCFKDGLSDERVFRSCICTYSNMLKRSDGFLSELTRNMMSAKSKKYIKGSNLIYLCSPDLRGCKGWTGKHEVVTAIMRIRTCEPQPLRGRHIYMPFIPFVLSRLP